ncbi:UDP-galactopyranose mutase [Posidoniimonas corsicana]|uniref:UDP-galactopyranose mutase n=1 Tax=Posidoniimonas corsicana TaxID=1938618 RepID=A0A5C5VB61_9BACT|nr:UDP-galactopyranose mutase [Posidoniimonas corsicana]TWT35197.1 UDP-galactopyranose mutase [Posidoniimonas corsicana]
MKDFDFLVVGAGLFGATFARRAADCGMRSLVIDRREHVSGNCFTESVDGIDVHRYGPHIFHTASDRVWAFVRRFGEFNKYQHRGRVSYKGRLYSFPINLATLRQVWGVESAAEARERIATERVAIERPKSMKDWLLSQVGEELYEMFFRGYTLKQWGQDPANLPAEIARRIPIRMTENDRYFKDSSVHEGIPVEGYTNLVASILDAPQIRVELGVDYFSHREQLSRQARRVVFSGKIDQYFGYERGRLAYRSLRFDDERLQGDYQSVAIVNYTDEAVPFTRITEHKHFAPSSVNHTIVTREYSMPHDRCNEPYYPVRDAANNAVLAQYEKLAGGTSVVFGGRLASYRYLDMDQVIAQAIRKADSAMEGSLGRTLTTRV